MSTGFPEDSAAQQSFEASRAACGLDLALRQLQLLCSTGNASAAEAWAHRLKQQQQSGEAAASSSAAAPSATAAAATAAASTSGRLLWPLPDAGGAHWGAGHEDACRQLLLQALDGRPDLAWVLWASCAHIAVAGRLPPPVEQRLGYPQRALQLDLLGGELASSAVGEAVEGAMAAAAAAVSGCFNGCGCSGAAQGLSAALALATLAHSALVTSTTRACNAAAPTESDVAALTLLPRLFPGVTDDDKAAAEGLLLGLDTATTTAAAASGDVGVKKAAPGSANATAGRGNVTAGTIRDRWLAGLKDSALIAISVALQAERLLGSAATAGQQQNLDSMAAAGNSGVQMAGGGGVARDALAVTQGSAPPKEGLPAEIYALATAAAALYFKVCEVPEGRQMGANGDKQEWLSVRNIIGSALPDTAILSGPSSSSLLLRERGWMLFVQVAHFARFGLAAPKGKSSSQLMQQWQKQALTTSRAAHPLSTAELVFRDGVVAARNILRGEHGQILEATRAALSASRHSPGLQSLVGGDLLRLSLQPRQPVFAGKQALVQEVVSELLRSGRLHLQTVGLGMPFTASDALDRVGTSQSLPRGGGGHYDERTASVLGPGLLVDLAQPLGMLQELLPIMDDKTVSP